MQSREKKQKGLSKVFYRDFDDVLELALAEELTNAINNVLDGGVNVEAL